MTNQKEQIAVYELSIAAFEQREKELFEQIYNLMCCGNCTYYVWNSCHLSGSTGEALSSKVYCCHWQSDNLTRKEREIK